MPKLSILVPTYNRSKLLAECLDGILSTQVDCEVLVRDDASTDDTAEVMAGYVARDPRVTYVRNAVNQGGNNQFNLLTADASGEYLTVMPDDDLPMPSNYDKKVAILDAHPEVGFVYSFRGLRHLDTGQIMYPRRVEQLLYSYIGGRNEFQDLMPGNYIPGNTVVWRKSLTDRWGGLDSAMGKSLSDWDLWLRFTYRTQTAYLNEPLVLAGYHTNRLSSNSVETTLAMLLVWRKWLIDGDELIVLDARMWQRMREMFLM
ncbi:MAG TPA: glycosyltransferase family 2 protein, partial [Chloroflexota bacterium]|nr:glycosyltransferase family 2 protein [Chloroflexota bacterium]